MEHTGGWGDVQVTVTSLTKTSGGRAVKFREESERRKSTGREDSEHRPQKETRRALNGKHGREGGQV